MKALPRLVVAAALVLASGCALVAPNPPPAGSPSVPTTPAPPAGSDSAPVPSPVRPEGFTDPPPGLGLSRYSSQPLDWRPCGAGECVSVKAPLDYSQPDGVAITVSLARRLGTARQKLGVLFTNPGGPGGSGVDYVRSFDRAGLEAYDIVGWDPRGVGRSTPVRCFGGEQMAARFTIDGTPDNAAERQALVDLQTAYGRSCLERSGDLLRHVSTVETVRDLDLLRVLLGQTKLNYLGFSYGTRIGALYAQLYGSNVGRMVLDGAVNITDNRDISQLDGFERALTNFADWCAGRRCALGTERQQVLDAVSELLRSLDQRPIDLDGRQLTQSLALEGVIFPLYFEEAAWPTLEAALQQARTGDGRSLLAIADEFTSRGSDGQYGQENYAFTAVQCLDQTRLSVAEAERTAERQAARAATLGPFFGPNFECPFWPVPATALPRITAPLSPPIVVVGTTGDPATPYEYAQGMAAQLEDAVLLTYRGEGHLGYRSSVCVAEAARDYLVRGDLPADGTTCG